jgi:hypothetical protein
MQATVDGTNRKQQKIKRVIHGCIIKTSKDTVTVSYLTRDGIFESEVNRSTMKQAKPPFTSWASI